MLKNEGRTREDGATVRRGCVQTEKDLQGGKWETIITNYWPKVRYWAWEKRKRKASKVSRGQWEHNGGEDKVKK